MPFGQLAPCLLGAVRAHFLVCETRPSALHPYNQSIKPLGRTNNSIVLSNLCSDATWGPWNRGSTMKHERVAEYIRSGASAPDDLIIFSDSDVILNAVDDATGIVRRFEEARSGHPRIRIVFSAEPFCWAPWAMKWPTGRVCNPLVVRRYQRVQNASTPPSCPRYLNAGSYAGRAKDVAVLVQQWRAGMSALAGGRVGAAWPGPPPQCYRGDQCVATHLLLNSNGTIGLDRHERLFAAAAMAVLPNSAEWRKANRGGGAIRCGDTRCRAQTRLDAIWQLVDIEGSASMGGRFQRPVDYRATCQTRGAPVLIHFQGVAKGILAGRALQHWLVRRAGKQRPPSTQRRVSTLQGETGTAPADATTRPLWPARGAWVSHFERRCTRWLIDIGCGLGVASEILLRELPPANWTFSTASYPPNDEGAARVASDYATRFAPLRMELGNTRGLCIAGLDGNPAFSNKLKARAAELTARGHQTVFLVPTVIGASDGNMSFYVDEGTRKYNFWGSSLFSNRWNRHGRGQKVTVPSYSLKTVFSGLDVRKKDTVILHMNAEGGEFLAIPPAIDDGSLCKYSDYLTLDLHYTYFRGAKAKRVLSREQLALWLNTSVCKTHLRSWVVW